MTKINKFENRLLKK